MSTLWRIAPACALFLVPIAHAQKTHIAGDYSQDFRQELPETPKPKPHAFNKRLFIAAEFALAGGPSTQSKRAELWIMAEWNSIRCLGSILRQNDKPR